MRLSRGVRRFALVVHIVSSVAWMGGSAVLFVLGAAVLTGDADPAWAYPAASLVGNTLVVPLSLTALATGLIIALGTRWGLFRHWWVTVKLATTALMVVLNLVLLTPGLREVAELGAAVPEASRAQMFFGPSVSFTMLAINVVLSVYKPGRSPSRSPRPTLVKVAEPVP